MRGGQTSSIFLPKPTIHSIIYSPLQKFIFSACNDSSEWRKARQSTDGADNSSHLKSSESLRLALSELFKDYAKLSNALTNAAKDTSELDDVIIIINNVKNILHFSEIFLFQSSHETFLNVAAWLQVTFYANL